MESSPIFLEGEAGHWTILIAAPILLVFGTLGNSLCMVVLNSGHLRTMPATRYLVALAVADSSVLWIGLPHWWLKVFGINIRDMSNVVCKLHVFLLYSAIHSSAWLLVVVTLQRLVCVCFPLSARVLSTPKSATLVIIAVIAVVFGLNMHSFWTFDVWPITVNNGTVRNVCYSQTYFVKGIWTWIDFSVSSFVPFVVIVICNAIIIYKIFQARKSREICMNVQQVKGQEKMMQLSVTLVTISFVFLLCTCPTTVYFIVEPYWKGVDSSPRSKASRYLTHTVAHFLFYLNSAINFILYCVTGPSFRQELARVVCHRGRPYRQTSKTSMTSFTCSTRNRSTSTFNSEASQYMSNSLRMKVMDKRNSQSSSKGTDRGALRMSGEGKQHIYVTANDSGPATMV